MCEPLDLESSSRLKLIDHLSVKGLSIQLRLLNFKTGSPPRPFFMFYG